MEAFFLRLVNMSLTASWLIVAVLLVRLLLGKAPAAVRCWLWALVGVRLCCPFSFRSMLSLIPSAEPIPPTIATDPTPVIDSGLPPVNAVVNPIITEAFTPAVGASVNPLQVVTAVAAIVWLVGIGGMLVYAAVGYLRMRRRVRACLPLAADAYFCDDIASPFILGLFRPRIYLPSGLDEAATDCILAHERAHLRRGDHIIKPLGFLLLAVHWFNPLVWVAYVALCRDIELACDERVVKSLDGAGKRAYSETLLACGARRRAVVGPLAFGEVGVKTRVKAVLHYKKPAFWLSLVAVLAVIAAAVLFLTDPIRDKVAPAAISEGFTAKVISANMEAGYRQLVEPETAAAREKYGERVDILTSVEYYVSQPYTSPLVEAGDRVWIEVGEATLKEGGKYPTLYPVTRYAKLPAQSAVSAEETAAITAFVTMPENNGLVGSLHSYAAPEEIDLNRTLYDGCGISRRQDELTAEEIAAGVPDEFVAVQAFYEEDVERFLQQRLGVGIADLKNGIGDVAYFEKLGLYAIYHADTNQFDVVVDFITRNKKGQYEVVYHAANDEPTDQYVATLRKAGDGYRFVSNLPAEGGALSAPATTATTTATATTSATTATTTAALKPDTAKVNPTVVVAVTEDAIIVDAKEHYIHCNDSRYAGVERFAFAVDAPGDFAVGDTVRVVHTGAFTAGDPPRGKPLSVEKMSESTVTFDETLANDIGITYTEAVNKYGVKVDQMGYRGGPFLRFKNSVGWMLFENVTYNFIDPDKSDEVIVDPDGKCKHIIATVGDVFKNTGPVISVKDIEQLLGCTVMTRDDMAHGDHQIIFHYNRRNYTIEIFPAADTFTPSDRIRVEW